MGVTQSYTNIDENKLDEMVKAILN